MKTLCLLVVSLFSACKGGRDLYDRAGYFWHITDMHYDGRFNTHDESRKGCWREDYDGSIAKSIHRRPMGTFGEYNCDSTWELIESAAKTMMNRLSDNVEFVLWTGDALSKSIHHLSHLDDTWQQKIQKLQNDSMQNITELLKKTFPSQFVFPVLGHDDPLPKKELGKMWSQWLPSDAMKTFETDGYYTIERKTIKLHIVVLNTNFMHHEGSDEKATKQWDWLIGWLDKFRQSGEKAYLVGHIPPGSDERHKGSPTAKGHLMYRDYHNRRYLQIVRNYSSIIVGQFFGHLHSDSFRVIYGENGRPVSWAMLSPSISPKRNHLQNNPGLRLYRFDKDSGQVFDYTQYYLDLSSANQNGKAEWVVEYNFSTYYGINDITPLNLHNLADKLTQDNFNDNSVLNKYYKANSVKLHQRTEQKCDFSCAHSHYCAITRIDFTEHAQCLSTYASALASSTRSNGGKLEFVFNTLCLLVVYSNF